VVKAAIQVEYDAVEIGGKTYICPVRSVSITKAQTVQLDPPYKFPLANQLQPMMESLNHVEFRQYHLFRADVRVLAGETPSESLARPSAASPAVSDSARFQLKRRRVPLRILHNLQTVERLRRRPLLQPHRPRSRLRWTEHRSPRSA